MSKPSLREDILNAGLKVMFRSGYQGATVRDICAAAGAPHGSFTNHFRSKETFAREVPDRFFMRIKRARDDFRVRYDVIANSYFLEQTSKQERT